MFERFLGYVGAGDADFTKSYKKRNNVNAADCDMLGLSMDFNSRYDTSFALRLSAEDICSEVMSSLKVL